MSLPFRSVFLVRELGNMSMIRCRGWRDGLPEKDGRIRPEQGTERTPPPHVVLIDQGIVGIPQERGLPRALLSASQLSR